MKSSEANLGKYFSLPNPGLESYLSRVERGQPEEYRTTFYKGKSLNAVLLGWKPFIDQLQQKWPTLLDFENDLAKKVGPLSVQKPLKERLKDIDSYYDSILLESVPITDKAVSSVVREWAPISGMHLRGQKATLDKMKKSTNSGNPYFIKRKAAAERTVPAILSIKKPEVVQRLANDTQWLSAAILGWRGQEGGPTDVDVKQRVVWMFPFAVNVRELQFYQMAIELSKTQELVPAWIGMECVDERITKLFDTKGSKDLIVCTDFSKFDQHFNADMQDAARKIISRILNSTSESREWLAEVFPIKYMIPLVYSKTGIRRGPHGMGSGSGGTNFDETLTHRALQYEAALAHGATLNPNSMCLGDDGILSYPGITAEDVMRVYSSHGQEMNLDKQYTSTQDCTYLRRWHHKDYRINGVCAGVYSTYRALGRLCEQERFYDPEIWGPKMVALRQLSIIENCKYHPLRNEFAQYCMKGDKYRLGLDIPGFLDNILTIAQEAIELMPDFLGYTKSLDDALIDGIESWWIVQYLKSLK